MNILIYHFLAMSAMLNLFLMLYSIPKIRREKDYWKMRSTWYERYTDDLLAGYETLPPQHTEPPQG